MMNLYLLLLVPLACAINTPPSLLSSNVDPNTTLPLPSFDVSYRCASPAQRDPGRRLPSALDCLNVLTFILATTPNHDQPTQWSRISGYGYTILPYRRNSGSCQLFVRLTSAVVAPPVETASFDQVVGAAMRVVEVCLLNGRPNTEHLGGAAITGSGKYLDVVIWGTSESGDSEAAVNNETSAGNESGAWVNQLSPI